MKTRFKPYYKGASGLLLLSLLSLPMHKAFAESDAADDAKEMAQDLNKASKKAVRAAKDKTCNLVNGKMKCFAKKVKHKAQNIGDEIDDKMH